MLCENKLDKTYTRNIEGGNNAKILMDDEGKKFLKITFNKDESITYWFCKETIFYK